MAKSLPALIGLVALALPALPGLARAQPDAEHPVTPTATPDEELYSCKTRTGQVAVTLKPETEVKDLMAWVMGFTCKNFVLDPRIVLTGKKVTLIAPNKMSAAEAYKVFLVALSTIGLTVVPKGDVMRIVEAATAKKETVPIYKAGTPEATDQMVRYVYRPAYAQAETLQTAFAALKSDPGDVQLVGSILLITDYASHVHDMMSLAHLIDVPNGSDGIYTIAVQHADAAKLADKIGGILGLPTAAGPIAKAGAASPLREGSAVPSKILVDERTNTLVIAASEAGYLRVKALVERLDLSLDIEGGAAIHVYRLGSAISDELAKTLNDAISGQAGKAAAAPKTGAPISPVLDGLGTSLEGQVRVIGDAPTNSLIVVSSGRDFIAIKDVIRQLDQPRRQVYIEAVILEVRLSDDTSIGSSSHGGIPVGDTSLLVGGVQMPSLSSLNLSTLTSATGLIGGLIGSPLANSQTILGKSINSYGILFQALANSSNANILSAPSIIALDNAPAKYKVGTNIPYKKGSSVGGVGALQGAVSTQYDRKDLLLELDITPHISIDDTVLLEVKHNSEDLAEKDDEKGPTWTTRSFETRVLVRDQQTVVIGGLMQEKKIVNETKVPLLGDIPILGYLFKYSSKSKVKTNLLILLTPYVVKDQMDLEAIKARRMRDHDEFVRSFSSLEGMKYSPKIDYARKRGLLEEINRSVQAVDEEVAARASLHLPTPPVQGALEYPAVEPR